MSKLTPECKEQEESPALQHSEIAEFTSFSSQDRPKGLKQKKEVNAESTRKSALRVQIRDLFDASNRSYASSSKSVASTAMEPLGPELLSRLRMQLGHIYKSIVSYLHAIQSSTSSRVDEGSLAQLHLYRDLKQSLEQMDFLRRSINNYLQSMRQDQYRKNFERNQYFARTKDLSKGASHWQASSQHLTPGTSKTSGLPTLFLSNIELAAEIEQFFKLKGIRKEISNKQRKTRKSENKGITERKSSETETIEQEGVAREPIGSQEQSLASEDAESEVGLDRGSTGTRAALKKTAEAELRRREAEKMYKQIQRGRVVLSEWNAKLGYPSGHIFTFPSAKEYCSWWSTTIKISARRIRKLCQRHEINAPPAHSTLATPLVTDLATTLATDPSSAAESPSPRTGHDATSTRSPHLPQPSLVPLNMPLNMPLNTPSNTLSLAIGPPGLHLGSFVDHDLSPELNRIVAEMLSTLKYLDSQKSTGKPGKSKTHRLVAGLREVKREVDRGTAKLVIVAPNASIQHAAPDSNHSGSIESPDLLREITAIITVARQKDVPIPVIFALTRQKIGSSLNSRRPIAAVALLSLENLLGLQNDALIEVARLTSQFRARNRNTSISQR